MPVEPKEIPRSIPSLLEYNHRAEIVTPTSEFERLQNRLYKHQCDIEKSNEERKIESARLQSSRVFVYCALCSAKLNRKTGKDKEVDIGYGVVMNVQRWSCSVCKSGYVGYLPNVVHVDNPALKASVVEYGGSG
jgi:hypothetical protein